MTFFNSDLTALLLAVDRSQGRIEFSPDGTALFANANFLTLGSQDDRGCALARVNLPVSP